MAFVCWRLFTATWCFSNFAWGSSAHIPSVPNLTVFLHYVQWALKSSFFIGFNQPLNSLFSSQWSLNLHFPIIEVKLEENVLVSIEENLKETRANHKKAECTAIISDWAAAFVSVISSMLVSFVILLQRIISGPVRERTTTRNQYNMPPKHFSKKKKKTHFEAGRKHLNEHCRSSLINYVKTGVFRPYWTDFYNTVSSIHQSLLAPNLRPVCVIPSFFLLNAVHTSTI